MDLTNLEYALNNGNFKEKVYPSLEGVYQIPKVLNKLDPLKNFSDHDLEIVGKIQAIKNALAGYETSEQELKAQINALVNSLEAKKQELEALLNTQLQSVGSSETQKLNEAGNALKTQLIAELTQAKNNLAQSLNPQIQGIFKTPSEDYKIAVFARRHKDLWVNVNYTANTSGFETSFLNNARFRDLTTQSIATTYNNDRVFYKHSQALVYEILK
ncbi:hypothetical protein [Helicobacter pylori]